MSNDHLHALPAGYQLHEYRIEKVLGAGGFGITYLARDIHLDKVVAIKEYLPADLALRIEGQTVSPKSNSDHDDYSWGLDRFLKEAQTLARFDHPNLNRVHRLFEANGTAYMVLDYVRGRTLSSILKAQARLPEHEVKRLLKELTSGLELVHGAGFVHRDIKPGNIMIASDSSAVLLDFGAARQAIGQRSKDLTAILTPGYAPIEQYDTRAEDVGPWSDIYSLAMVAYRCISGCGDGQLLDAVTRSRFHRKGASEKDLIPAVQAGAGDYSPALLQAIDWGAQIDEDDRPQSIAEWQRALFQGYAGTAAEDDATFYRPSTQRPETGAKQHRVEETHDHDSRFSEESASIETAAENSPGTIDAKPRIPRWLLITAAAIVLITAQALSWYIYFYGFDFDFSGDDYYSDEQELEDILEGFEQNPVPDEDAVAVDDAETLTPAEQSERGYAYYSGDGVPQDYEKAAFWFEKAAENGFAAAQYNLGVLYENGDGVPQSDTTAFGWFLKSAEQDDVDGQYSVGWAYDNGVGIEQNDAKATEWYRKAAYQGHATAQNNLGVAYDIGAGVAEDEQEAVRWYRKAAGQGIAEAQYSLATKYNTGSGVDQSETEAVRWFRAASEQGHERAQNYLGMMYSDGSGVTQSDVDAYKWWLKSGEQGNADAQYNLGWAYHNAAGVGKDLSQAMNWYRKAAEQGMAKAEYMLGWGYTKGEGLGRDIAEGLRWYRRAAESGNASAQLELGVAYYNGDGIAQSDSDAAYWILKAAEQGLANAEESMGVLYEDGRGVTQSNTEALKWYRRAAAQGNETAREAAERLSP